MENKKYTFVTYNQGNVLNMVSFDDVEDLTGNELKDVKNIDKIKLFELNDSKDGRNLIKEFRLNQDTLKDSLLFLDDTKILKYELYNSWENTLSFRVIYEISKEVQQQNDLWYQRRYVNLMLVRGLNDEGIESIGAAYTEAI